MTENDLLAEPLKGEWGVRRRRGLRLGCALRRRAGGARRAGPHHARPGREVACAAGRGGPRRPRARGRDRREGPADPAAGRPRRSPRRHRARRAQARRRAASRTRLRWPARPPPRPPCCSATTASCRCRPGTSPGSPSSGPGAKDARALGGGSASVPLPYVATPFAGLRAALAGRAEVVTAVGATLSDSLRAARADELTGPHGGSPIVLRWLDADGRTVAEQPAGTATIIRLLSDVPDGAVELEMHTAFIPDEDGDWRLGVVGLGAQTLLLDGEPVLRGVRGARGLRRPPGLRAAAAVRRRAPARRGPAGRRPDPVPLAGERLHLPRRLRRRSPRADARRGARARRRARPIQRRGRRGRRHVRPGRERGLRPHLARAAGPAGRAGPRGGGRQPAHGRRRQLRCAGGAAVAGRGVRRPGVLVPGHGVRQRAGRRPAGRRRARRPAAHDVAGGDGATSPSWTSPPPTAGSSTPRGCTSGTGPTCAPAPSPRTGSATDWATRPGSTSPSRSSGRAAV